MDSLARPVTPLLRALAEYSHQLRFQDTQASAYVAAAELALTSLSLAAHEIETQCLAVQAAMSNLEVSLRGLAVDRSTYLNRSHRGLALYTVDISAPKPQSTSVVNGRPIFTEASEH